MIIHFSTQCMKGPTGTTVFCFRGRRENHLISCYHQQVTELQKQATNQLLHILYVSSRHKWKVENHYSTSSRNPETSHSVVYHTEGSWYYKCLKICPINQTYQSTVGIIDPLGALATWIVKITNDIFGTMWLQKHISSKLSKTTFGFSRRPMCI